MEAFGANFEYAAALVQALLEQDVGYVKEIVRSELGIGAALLTLAPAA